MLSVGVSHQNCSLITLNLFISTSGQKIQQIIHYITSMESPSNAYCNNSSLCINFCKSLLNSRKQLYRSKEKLVRCICSIFTNIVYCLQILRPQLIKDIITLEHIRGRAMKHILNDYNSTYSSN